MQFIASRGDLLPTLSSIRNELNPSKNPWQNQQCSVVSTMAFSTKTPRTLMNPDHPNPLHSKTQSPKSLYFLNQRKTHQISSTQPDQQLSVLNTNSFNTHNRNSHLHLLCLHGHLQQALNYLNLMQELQIPLDENVAFAMVRLCEWKRAFEEGSKVYCFLSNSRNPLSLRLGNASLSMFVRFGKLGDAWYVFGKMQERDVFSWNVLISGYAKKGFFDEALCLYHRMLWVGLKPDVYTFPCFENLWCCSKFGKR